MVQLSILIHNIPKEEFAVLRINVMILEKQ